MARRQLTTRARSVPALVVLALFFAASAAGQEEKVPRRPPDPFRVFVHTGGLIHTGDPANATLRAQLEEAMRMVRKRVERRRDWFQLAESADTADISLRIISYRQGHPRDLEGRGGRTEAMGDCWAMEFNYVDAVALAGDRRARLSGLDYRCVETGPSLRNAASHLAEELERFAKDNYAALSQLRARAREKEPQGDGAAPRARNASPERPSHW